MTERRIKISGTYPARLRGAGKLRPFSRTVPSLRLAGSWLAAAGFGVGGEVRIEIERGRLIVTAVLPAAPQGGEAEPGGQG